MELMKTLNLSQFQDPVDWDSLKGNLVILGHGPQRIMTLVITYLIIVKKVGPMLMERKQPYDLRGLVRIFNLFNIIVNVWLAYRGIRLSGNGTSFFNCNCLDRDPKRFSLYVDIFILSRIIDFMDTIFFILRKKESQVTGLHVFHHSMVPVAMYLVATFSMSPFNGFLIILNSIVHIVMYTYYLLATFPKLAPYLWWKRHITKIQIGQFVISLIYFAIGYVLLPRFCDNPPMVPVFINLISSTIFLFLFLSFYSVAYKKSNNKCEQKRK